MGNSSSSEYEQFKEYYVKHGEANDPRYGHVVYYHHRNQPSDLVMVKDKWTNSLGESQDINTFVENRQSINHPNLAPCRNYIQEEDKQWCSTFYKHNLAFEYYDNNLEKKLQRNNADADFGDYKALSEPELWYIANSATNVDLTLAREGGGYHGDIQPGTIMFDKEEKVKIADSGLLHLNKTLYQRMLYDRNVKGALSPTLLAQLQQKKVNPTYDANKEESWAIGMTSLCAATNTTLDDYYDWSVPELKRLELNEKLDSINGPYSKQFHGFVESCLEESEDRRASLEDHEKMLRPHQRDINELKLNFKQRKVQGAPPPQNNPILYQEVKNAPSKPQYTGLVTGEDFFFNNPSPNEIYNELQPVVQEQPVNLAYDDFFNQKETIIENNRGDFFYN